MEIIVKNLEETEKLAKDFVEKLLFGVSQKEATVVTLKGDLGAGKTAFVKGVAEALGIKKELVTSPTFVIQKIYELKDNKFHKLIHIDAYRFEDLSEAEVLPVDELFSKPRNLIFIEWPERMETLIPKDAHKLEFTFIDESTRKIKIHPPNFSKESMVGNKKDTV